MFLLDWAVVFLVLALVAGVMGFGGIAKESAGIARILFVVFLVIYAVAFISNGHHRSLYNRLFNDNSSKRN